MCFVPFAGLNFEVVWILSFHREWFLKTSLEVKWLEIGFQLLNHAYYYCLMAVTLSIVTPIITSGLGPAAQHGVNALP